MPTRRFVALAAIGAATIGTVIAVPAAGAAHRTTSALSGSTVLQFNNQVLKPLTSDGCGAFTATPLGNAGVVSTGAGKVKVTLPITSAVIEDDQSGFRLTHSGSGVDFANECYDVRLSNFYVQHFGRSNQSQSLDVLAVAKHPDQAGKVRESVFTIDLSGANYTERQNSAVIRSADLLLTAGGADEFNQFVAGDPSDEAAAATTPASGPFMAGQQVGKGRITLKLPADSGGSSSGQTT